MNQGSRGSICSAAHQAGMVLAVKFTGSSLRSSTFLYASPMASTPARYWTGQQGHQRQSASPLLQHPTSWSRTNGAVCHSVLCICLHLQCGSSQCAVTASGICIAHSVCAEHTLRRWAGQPGRPRRNVRLLWHSAPSWPCARLACGKLQPKPQPCCRLLRSRLRAKLRNI